MGRGVLLLLLAAALSLPAHPAEPPTEYEVKAAFIYNFAKYVEWPRDADAAGEVFVVTILGRDPFGEALDHTLRGKTVSNKKVVVRRVSGAEDVGDSHILFISDSEMERLSSILERVDTAAVLTVGEMARFAERGGVIRLRVDRGRIRLEINVAAARRSRLRISSELLKLARIVDNGAGG